MGCGNFRQEGQAYIATKPRAEGRSIVTVSLGVGENPAKRIGDPFEAELLRALLARGAFVVIDKGASVEEAARVDAAVKGISPQSIEVWEGAFARFAAQIAGSSLYIGYD